LPITVFSKLIIIFVQQILKEQMLEVETFLPLDYLQVKPLKERLRNISDPRNVRLVNSSMTELLCH